MLLSGNPQHQTTSVSAFQVSEHTGMTYKLLLGKMGTKPISNGLILCKKCFFVAADSQIIYLAEKQVQCSQFMFLHRICSFFHLRHVLPGEENSQATYKKYIVIS